MRPRGSLEPAPPFHDPAQSAAAVWDVWLSAVAGTLQIRHSAQLRLRELLAWARERSPFYRNRYRGIRVHEARLEELPVLTKSELMAHFDAVVTDPDISAARVRDFVADPRRAGHPFLGRYAVWSSSGTTGEPGLFLHDGRALAVYEALHAVRFRRLTSPSQVIAAWLAADRYALVSVTGHFAGCASVERLRLLYPWLAGQVRIFSILEAQAALAQQLNEYQPTLLATYPTVASLLADAQRAGQLAIHPREIWTGGEQLTAVQKAHIADAFDCAVHDDYGASEFLAIGWSCERGMVHVNADWVLLEPVDERYRTLPPGVASHTTLLTNLANRVQPLIRYDLGDSITWIDGACECGSPLPAIRVEGRCDDIVALTDAGGRAVKLLPLALTTVLEDAAGLFRFQLFQVGASALVLRIAPEASGADMARRSQRALDGFLRTQGLPNVRVEVETAPLQPHSATGKLRRVVARPGPGGEQACMDATRCPATDAADK